MISYFQKHAQWHLHHRAYKRLLHAQAIFTSMVFFLTFHVPGNVGLPVPKTYFPGLSEDYLQLTKCHWFGDIEGAHLRIVLYSCSDVPNVI